MLVLGIAGILLALILFMFFVYKGYSIFVVAPVCALLIAVTNGLNLLTSFTETYVSSLLDTVSGIFGMIFLGVIFGRVMQETGASKAIADLFTKQFIFKAKDKDGQIKRAVISILVFSGLMTYGGIDSYTQLFITFPVIVALCKKLDLPRRVIPSWLTLGCAYIAAPGTPMIYNLYTQTAFSSIGIETQTTYGLIPGLIGIAIIVVCIYFYASKFAIKVKNKGETFDWGTMTQFDTEQETKTPPLFLAILPLIVVFVMYTLLHLHIVVALTTAIILSLVLMNKWVVKGQEPKAATWFAVKRVVNDGVASFPTSVLQLAVPAGLAGVVTVTAAFGKITDFFAGINIPVFILLLIVVCILVALTSSPIVGVMIAIPLIVGVCQTRGIDLNIPAFFRIAALAATTFETLPTNGAPLLCMMLTGTTHKESYKPIFCQSVLFTLIGAVVCTGIYMVFPNII